ncbi:hsf-type dna [Plasmopara halstedii]|uniref:Hsf-type dna n=1 Tax=Plasmopara halstedii TaxID=4781 RepID=A0A0N7L766_PLAHL|nr:hsf-type dna [Plasmopara halstedii]CEG46219.1 hsf-type dna [Plasmopara halstedii]|eukprot:XP_024582588.1 hsf-type dna [Plasmopara halstedii]
MASEDSETIEGEVTEPHPLRICVMAPASTEPDSLDTPESSERNKRPRREEAALFLEKTYELLERCPSDVASWTIKGDSFVVKQPAVFAEHVIPTYFKHRKFSSFVRQLNLYGFRKVRATSASALIDDIETGVEEDASPKDWWEFRHERFVRGRRDLLCEIRRRSPSDTRVSTPLGIGIPVERVEFDELRVEVSGLREEMQKIQRTNEHLTSLLQNLLQRFSRSEPDGGFNSSRQEFNQTPNFGTSPSVARSQHRPLPSITLPSPTANSSLTGPQQALLQLRQGLQPPSTPRDIVTPRTPASGTFQLRPLQSLMVKLSPGGRPTPSPHPSHNYVRTPSYSQQQQEQPNRNKLRLYQTKSSPTAHKSPLKRLRLDSTTSGNDLNADSNLRSPEDVAVRELSRMASDIRTELLACITARVTGFLRVHREQTDPTRDADADAVAKAVGSDIRQKLALLQASTSSTDPMLLDAETTCMYRVEILKFISRELPRAVQDAVDKRLPSSERLKQRSAKDRSLLALLVQKAQKALECQMHSETAAVSTGRR